MPPSPRSVALVNAAVGAGLLVAGRRLLRRVNGSRTDGIERTLCALVGGRQVAQGLATAAAPANRAARDAWVVDLLHAASMLPVVLLSPRHRRPAAVSGGWAALVGLAGLAAARGRTSGR